MEFPEKSRKKIEKKSQRVLGSQRRKFLEWK
jgi:hypothetical protein